MWLSIADLLNSNENVVVDSKEYVTDTGTAQKTVSLKVLRRFQVPKITKNHQRGIAADLDNLTETTTRLEAVFQKKITALDDLKKSLLHQAFSGNL